MQASSRLRPALSALRNEPPNVSASITGILDGPLYIRLAPRLLPAIYDTVLRDASHHSRCKDIENRLKHAEDTMYVEYDALPQV